MEKKIVSQHEDGFWILMRDTKTWTCVSKSSRKSIEMKIITVNKIVRITLRSSANFMQTPSEKKT